MIDGALDPWVEHLLDVLLQHYPLPLAQEEDTIPADRLPPRVSIGDVTSDATMDPDSLDADEKYHTALVKCNKQTTTEDWFQDVRHFEFSFEEDIKYNPGDVAVVVAVVHPFAGWENLADDMFTVEHTMLDQTFPDHVPNIVSFESSSHTTSISMLFPVASFSNCCDMLLPTSLIAKN
ncbi:hypothetical protein M405DRAFT_858799 [Rhizopogon salebrosus TDB-379]|nr:hypothetical protein M405DRAFT_858799 [Rhizopogon salebrosus TDB-379]